MEVETENLPSPISEAWIEGSPVVVQSNEILGRYTVASRRILEGQLLGEEHPMTFAAYSPSPDIRPCLACCQGIRHSSSADIYQCKCQLPICSKECGKAFQHAENECKVFTENQLEPPECLDTDDYLALEVIRALLVRDRNPGTWNRILGMESHMNPRASSEFATRQTKHVNKFIREFCKQTQFDSLLVDKIVGVITVNSFWTYKDCGRYISALYEKMSLIPNDCGGNTRRTVELKENNTKNVRKSETREWTPIVKEFASKTIEAGEIVTARYSQIPNVQERRAFLKSLFYFDCSCKTCLFEMRDDKHE